MTTSLWLIFAGAVATVLFSLMPAAMILKRMGFSPWLAITGLLPGMSIVGLWIVALSKWPIDDQRPDQGASS